MPVWEKYQQFQHYNCFLNIKKNSSFLTCLNTTYLTLNHYISANHNEEYLSKIGNTDLCPLWKEIKESIKFEWEKNAPVHSNRDSGCSLTRKEICGLQNKNYLLVLKEESGQTLSIDTPKLENKHGRVRLIFISIH